MNRPGECPLCGAEKVSYYLTCTDHLVSGETYDLFICNACGFVLTHDPPDEEAMGRYYASEDYVSHSDTKAGVINRLYSLARNIMLSRKLRIISAASGLRKGSILDIGCGTGYFAAKMKANGWNSTGIEPDCKAREFGTRQFGLSILEPEKISSLPGESCDVITMWHSLEHSHDPFNYMQEILRLLKPEGLFISALPNCGSYDAMHFGDSWAAYDVPRHLWHFTPETFELFAAKTGFKVTHVSTLPFDVFYISLLSEKHRNRKLYLLSGLAKGSFFSVRAVFNYRKSSSLVYHLRRR
ncbi:MAG TPA: class I SAM-dependent methyltransferase [Bacteroidales bacterium]|jgi:2-polyprenyl-3-methyl-5-hydroxy-6-metoxy-1,4-benzoquinol methylase/rubredoxin|nr:methyltransferase domain-containing protein [Bacteroidales bacterium]HNR42666.1 class I SAM-dependent methyltransferase [Bacteroidales bacterium]HPM17856.1 class I SAM-dependent methyltransferase [Bacteroidales bacterium]HQH24750.1 class I SAM-dependent methyltransferase [Bacteroidales bacterium]